MKNTRTLASVAGTLVLVTGTASLALLGGGGGGAANAAGEPSSAFGLELVAAGTDVIAAMPAVESTTGAVVTDSLVELPDNPLVTGGVINVSAENGQASSSVADLGVGAGLLQQVPQLADLVAQLQPVCDALDSIDLSAIEDTIIDPITGTLLPGILGPILDAVDDAAPVDLSLVDAIDLSALLPDQLGSLCDLVAGGNLVGAAAVTAECTGDTGNVVITDLGVVGLPSLIDTNTPNSSVEVPGLLELTVNRQTNNADGTFTVDALYLNLLDQIELTVASATCGEVTNETSDAPTPTDPPTTNFPVTG